MEKILWLILFTVAIPCIGIYLSAIAGGYRRVIRRPPYRQSKKCINKAGNNY